MKQSEKTNLLLQTVEHIFSCGQNLCEAISLLISQAQPPRLIGRLQVWPKWSFFGQMYLYNKKSFPGLSEKIKKKKKFKHGERWLSDFGILSNLKFQTQHHMSKTLVVAVSQ